MRFVESPTPRCVVLLINEKTLVRFFYFFFFCFFFIFVSTLKYEQRPNTFTTTIINHGINSIFALAVLAVPDGRTRWKRRRFVVVSIVVFSYVRRQKRFQFDFERRRRIWKTLQVARAESEQEGGGQMERQQQQQPEQRVSMTSSPMRGLLSRMLSDPYGGKRARFPVLFFCLLLPCLLLCLLLARKSRKKRSFDFRYKN